MNPQQRTLSRAVAAPLAATLVQCLADMVGVRVLFIKGTAATLQGLRGPRVPADVDVLVEPDRYERLVDAFTSRGWQARYTTDDALRVLPSHSVTLLHPNWPLDLDLHFYFVGTFADPGVSFVALSEGSTRHPVAGAEITLPGLAAHRLVLTLNALRDTGNPRADGESDRLAESFRADPQSWNDVLRVASATRSLSMLREFASRHGFEVPEHDLNAAELRQRDLLLAQTADTMTSIRYRLGDPSTSFRVKARMLRYYLFKPASIIALERPDFTGGFLQTFRVNAQRVRTGIRQLIEHRRHRSRFADRRHASSSRTTASQQSAFMPSKPEQHLPYAELRTVNGEITVVNGESLPPAEPTPDFAGVLTSLGGKALLTAAPVASVTEGGIRYLLALDPEYLTEVPNRTPPVLTLDLVGQEIFGAFEDAALDIDGCVRQVCELTGAPEWEVAPGVKDFIAELSREGILRVVASE